MSNELYDAFAAEAESRLPSNEELEQISVLANKQVKVEADIARTEKELKELKKQLKKVSEDDLPTAMKAAGNLLEFKLADGTAIKVADKWHGSLSGAKKAGAIAWLREHGYDDIIKTTLELSFKKGEDEKVTQAKELLIEQGFIPKEEENVNTATVKALAKELIEDEENNIDVPLDTLGIYIQTVSKVTI